MKTPLSWLKDYVDIDLSLEDLARVLTMTGLEVDEVHVVGMAIPKSERQEFKFTGLSWDADKIVVAQVDEVMPHPNADRLVLCRLKDGQQEHVVLTGAPNLYPYKGQGALPKPLKVAYAREGATLYDGHQPGQVLSTLKRAKIRGVESYSMICSEKELGISDEHEGVIILDDDAPTGMPLVDYMGDAVFEISILPNMSRNTSILGVAREIAAQTGKTLHRPKLVIPTNGKSIEGMVKIEINDPDRNPRFVFGLVRNVEARPSPYIVQRRLRLAGMRPINGIVDATNYVMFEVGEPLHAFDYDVLVRRAGGKPPIITTRAAKPGEHLTTLEGIDRVLDTFSTVICDEAGSLSLAGLMGGLESEVTAETRTVLLEGASWNLINTRRTASAQKLSSEAAYRFSRGIHPEMAPDGLRVGLERMAAWSGGEIAAGLVDTYPKPQVDPVVTVSTADVKRLLGIELPPRQIATLLSSLEFECSVQGESVVAKTPPHRLDIGTDVIGIADVIEEVARLYGYDNIPAERLSDELPPQKGNLSLDREDHLRDVLVNLGLQEIMNYRLTSPESEERAMPLHIAPKDVPFVRLQNPIAVERCVMRRNLLPQMLETLERNIRLRERLAFFEIGPVFLPQPGEDYPAEPARLCLGLSGSRRSTTWNDTKPETMDFFDLKGIIESALAAMHVPNVGFEPAGHPVFHPGKSAQVHTGDTSLGIFGELHPLVKERYDFGAAPVLVAELDLSALLAAVPVRYDCNPVYTFPPVLEDIAIIVAEDLPAAKAEEIIRQAGGKILTGVRLFDIFRSEQIGAGKKSLAYSLTYQAQDRTLTDVDATKIRQRIVRLLEQEVGAKLRG